MLAFTTTVAGAVYLPAKPAPSPVLAKTAAGLEIAMRKCMPDFNSEAYLELAAALQALPKDQAIAQLRQWACSDLAIAPVVETESEKLERNRKFSSSAHYEFQVVVLCRMLFEAPAGKTFRAPRLRYRPLGGTSATDWPLTPIALVDGIPFDVRSPVRVGGSGPSPERAGEYLEYCLSDLQWTSRRYVPAKPEELKRAFNDLLFSPVWTVPLNDPEFDHLPDQIKPPVYTSPPLFSIDLGFISGTSGSGMEYDPAPGEHVDHHPYIADAIEFTLVNGDFPYHYMLIWSDQPGSMETFDTYKNSLVVWTKAGPENADVTTTDNYFESSFAFNPHAPGTALTVEVTDKNGHKTKAKIIFPADNNLEIHRWNYPLPKP